jgi:hypothetical protein
MMMTDNGPFFAKKAEVLHDLLTDDRVRLDNFVGSCVTTVLAVVSSAYDRLSDRRVIG